MDSENLSVNVFRNASPMGETGRGSAQCCSLHPVQTHSVLSTQPKGICWNLETIIKNTVYPACMLKSVQLDTAQSLGSFKSSYWAFMRFRTEIPGSVLP